MAAIESINWNTPGRDMLALITGASSGIGAATAKLLGSKGMKVVLVARRKDRLDRLVEEIQRMGGTGIPMEADLTHERDRDLVLEEVTKNHGEVDYLVNNAGLGWYGYGADMSWRTALEMLQVNVEAVVQFTINILARMRSRNAGHIINIGSISGSLPSQGVALYGATKSFLDNFSTALHRELEGTGVHVSVVRAGPVKTEFSEAALARDHGGHVPTERMGVSAEYVASRIWNLIQKPRRVIYIPDWLRLVPWAELTFGWVIDRLGPLLLKREKS
jgi:short-subunit dehydrogenase